jgi:hypothetical protein
MNTLKAILSKPPVGKGGLPVLILMILVITPGTASADVSGETAYVLNTLSFLMHGFLVLWMAAGFAMLEAGLVRTKSVTTILLKNVALFSRLSLGVDRGRCGCDERRLQRWLRLVVRLVLSDGVRCNCGLHRVRRPG